MTAGLNIGQAAIALIHDALEPHGDGTLAELTELIGHLDGTKAELREALAYASAQVYAYRTTTNEDAALALYQIRTALSNFEART